MTTMSSSILTSAAVSASYNMILQMLFRGFTFVLNALVLRYVSSDMLGVVNVRLTLLYSTCLFMSREAFRRACLNKTSVTCWPQLINLLWCTVAIGVVLTTVFGYIWAYLLDAPDPHTAPYYTAGVCSFGLSVIIELLAEPLWVVSQIFLFVRLKVFIEGIALAVRCLVTALLIVYYPTLGIWAFSIAQLLFTLIYTLLYYWYFINLIVRGNTPKDFPFTRLTDLLPQRVQKQSFISWHMASLTWSFLKQSFLKQILTEGEKYVMSIFAVLSFADQGVYDVICNLGSLVARLVFLPIEDSAYLFFSQTLDRGSKLKETSQESAQLASQVLEALLRLVTLVGLTFLVFGYAYSYLLLDLYGGDILSSGSGPLLLRCYCVFVLFLAVNGITECFAFATMSKSDIDRYNFKLLIFSAVFLVSSCYLTRLLSSVGFVLANCLNMSARITHSLHHIWRYYRHSGRSPLRALIPTLPVQLMFVAAFGITFLSEGYLCCSRGLVPKLLHIGIGGVCLLCLLVTIYATDTQLITFIRQQYGRRTPKTENKSQ